MIEANDCVMVMADYDLYKILMIILISLLSDAKLQYHHDENRRNMSTLELTTLEALCL